MKVLVTGASGYLGEALSRFLAAQGIPVIAMYRTHFPSTLPETEGIEIAHGDITEAESVLPLIRECSHVFHVAAYCYNWAKDHSIFHNINVQGTRNMLQLSLDNGIEKFIYTSSAGTLGPVDNTGPVNEAHQRKTDFFNLYEKTKHLAEKAVREYASKGLHTVIVNPTRIFGPGLLGGGNFTTELIRRYIKGTWRFVPGDGKSTGNYVFIDDVVKGHLLALHKGRNGESYILGGENMDFNTFFSNLASVSGKKRKLIHIPMPIMRTVTFFTETYAGLTGRAPGLMTSDIKRYTCNWAFDISKAETALDYKPTSMIKALRETIQWLQSGTRSKGFALITGSGAGIGRALAEECARKGFSLVLVSRANKERLNALAGELRKKYSVDVLVTTTDLSKSGADELLYRWVKDQGISINMLINNAGKGGVGSFQRSAAGDNMEMLEINIKSLTGITQRFLPLMLQHRKSYLLNVSSLAAFQAVPYKAVYAASKSYVRSFTLALRKELEGRIHVSVLCPGAVPTNEIIRQRIHEQGTIGRWSITSAEYVARKGIEGLLKNKAVIIPGKVNQILWLISKITPFALKQRKLAKAFGRKK